MAGWHGGARGWIDLHVGPEPLGMVGGWCVCRRGCGDDCRGVHNRTSRLTGAPSESLPKPRCAESVGAQRHRWRAHARSPAQTACKCAVSGDAADVAVIRRSSPVLNGVNGQGDAAVSDTEEPTGAHLSERPRLVMSLWICLGPGAQSCRPRCCHRWAPQHSVDHSCRPVDRSRRREPRSCVSFAGPTAVSRSGSSGDRFEVGHLSGSDRERTGGETNARCDRTGTDA